MPVPLGGQVAEPVPALPAGGVGAPQGLFWSWELDFGALLEALAAAGLGNPDDLAAHAGAAVPAAGAAVPAASAAGDGPAAGAAAEAGDGVPADAGADAVAGDVTASGSDGGGVAVPVGMLAGRVAERLAPGPDLAGWLSQAPATELGDYDLAATVGSWRRLASWAQAKELAAVAQIASRAASRDKDIGVAEDGRPAQVPVSAAAEVALELTMSQYAAAGWAELAVDLAWRLSATGAALAGGQLDLPRARLIAEATAVLDDDTARAVEARVLPAAGRQSTGMLRAALRRAVITADPHGAERRRQQRERQAKVVLYPDQDSTATLAGQQLPAIGAAAAMARITALARAMKAAGAPGPADLLRAQVYLGLLLGTLPPIPPAEDAPPDHPPDDPYSDAGEPGSPGEPGGPGEPGSPGDDRPGRGPGGSPAADRRGGPGAGGRGGGLAAARLVTVAAVPVMRCRRRGTLMLGVMRCRRRGTLMLPAKRTSTPARMAPRPAPATMTMMMACGRLAARRPGGRPCPSCRPRLPGRQADSPPAGCWTSPCPGRYWPGPAPRPGT